MSGQLLWVCLNESLILECCRTPGVFSLHHLTFYTWAMLIGVLGAVIAVLGVVLAVLGVVIVY